MPQRVAPASHQVTFRWVGWLAAGGLGVLSAVVAARWTVTFDEHLLQLLRPKRVWGPRQVSLSVWPRLLSTTNTLVAMAILAGVAATVRRSWRPAMQVALVLLGVVALTVAVKVLVPREDPTLTRSVLGSFPSGHVAACCAFFLTASLAFTGRVTWWSVVLAAATAAWMSYVMVAIGMHWATDCLAGVLVSVVSVRAVSAWGTAGHRRGSVGAARRPRPVRGAVS
jgi:membrane-associated phospholipid phosphatase